MTAVLANTRWTFTSCPNCSTGTRTLTVVGCRRDVPDRPKRVLLPCRTCRGNGYLRSAARPRTADAEPAGAPIRSNS